MSDNLPAVLSDRVFEMLKSAGYDLKILEFQKALDDGHATSYRFAFVPPRPKKDYNWDATDSDDGAVICSFLDAPDVFLSGGNIGSEEIRIGSMKPDVSFVDQLHTPKKRD